MTETGGYEPPIVNEDDGIYEPPVLTAAGGFAELTLGIPKPHRPLDLLLKWAPFP
ncbi:lasso RiPP family leader peptide-containing protein [Actinomadura rubrisoli]|uniref:Lasso RiPP family leader peptide-containing protein n=1 Tax=Actinomadura rubrisoli TaxID=2530368 RepID=A0A4R5C1D5_9ACTN|nr:lasso RiPP family leader peptide-containing protein [Actinomadura rubrisoli]TDD91843.1 lasso RiPP family leader peptide-containing protein [Actinomadura rubrisoli]